MSEMLVHVLIQTAISFEMLKTYRGFCIFLPIKVCTLRLCRLEVSARSQVLKISFFGLTVVQSERGNQQDGCGWHVRILLRITVARKLLDFDFLRGLAPGRLE